MLGFGRSIAQCVALLGVLLWAQVPANAQTSFPAAPDGNGGVNTAVVACINGATQAAACSPVEVCQTLVVTASSAYSAGNEVGGLVTLTIPQTAAGQILVSVRLDFKDAQTAGFKVYQFSANPSNSTWTDKSTPSINAADVFKVLPPLSLAANDSGLGTHTVYGQDAINRALARLSTSDYFVIVTTGTPTFGSTSDAQFCAAYL